MSDGRFVRNAELDRHAIGSTGLDRDAGGGLDPIAFGLTVGRANH